MLSAIGIIVTLIVMEGLLSADNALVLAIMVKRIPQEALRKKALFYGMWGAVGFRAICILCWTWVAKLWIIKVIGALYLAKMTIDHFIGGDEEEEQSTDKFTDTFLHRLLGKLGISLSTFWAVVISVEIMDIAFSVDSILAAFALSTEFWVLLAGGALGILMMRSVAGIFLKLIAKVPEFEHTAYILIGIIAVKMFLGTIHQIAGFFGKHMEAIEINDILFFSILVLTFLATFVVHYFKKPKIA